MKKLYILLSTVLLTSCSGFLTEEPVVTQSTDLTLSTYNGLNNAVAGAYSALVSLNWYGANFVLESEMRAGNAKIPTSSSFQSGRLRTSYQMNYSPESTSSLWRYGYETIAAANNVINNLEGKETGSVTTQDLNNLRAEALFLRALSHFDILRLYAHTYSKNADALGIPIILESDQTGLQQPARNTVAEVYQQIIKDLLEAESVIDKDYKRSGVADNKATADIHVIRALLARVYLNMGNWQNAADYATKVIDSGEYRMWSATEYVDVQNVWGAEMAGEGEVIFEIYGKRANIDDARWSGVSHMTNPKGYADCAASKDLVNLYTTGDVRGSLFRTDANNESGGEMWTTKYYGKGDGDAVNSPDVNNVIVLRLSEMYLIRAEAINEGATISGVTSLADINSIVTNRGLVAYTSVDADIIFEERRKELAFEGHYWFDLARSKKALSYSDGVVTRNLTTDDAYWALPIPKRETDVNKNLVQNTY